MSQSTTLSVTAIKDGTVIDHILSGQVMNLIELLDLTQAKQHITICLNLPSKIVGTKDLIKISNMCLSEKSIENIAIFAPQATINIIRNYLVEEKIKAHLPRVIDDIIVCPNSRCITNSEPIKTTFFVTEMSNQVTLRCKYCERRYKQSEIEEYRP